MEWLLIGGILLSVFGIDRDTNLCNITVFRKTDVIGARLEGMYGIPQGTCYGTDDGWI